MTEQYLHALTLNRFFLRLDHFNTEDLKPGEQRWSLFRIVFNPDMTTTHERVLVLVYVDYPKMVEAAYEAAVKDTIERGLNFVRGT